MKKTAFGIFLKHFSTSIRRRPLQPFLLIAVLSIAVAVCVTALNTRDFSYTEKRLARQANYGNANVIVNIDTQSTSRFLFASEAKKLLSDGESVCGVFYLPVYINNENIFSYCVATDFLDFCKVFDADFYEYESFTKEQKTETVFISSAFAEKNNIHLGETVDLKIFGYSSSFVVRGVSNIPYMNEYDVMIDIDCLETVLSATMPALAFTEIDIYPCTEIYIHSDNPGKTIETLRSQMVCQANHLITQEISTSTLEIIMLIVVLLAILFSMLTIFVIFTVLNYQRREENALLFGVGAKPYMLTLFSMAETFFYWIIGSGLGILLSVPLSQILIDYVGFSFVEYHSVAKNIGVVIGIMLIAVECNISLCTGMDAIKKKKEKAQKPNKKDRKGKVGLIINAIVGVLYFVFFAVLKWKVKDEDSPIGYIAILLACFWLFSLTKYLFPLIWKKISKVNWHDVTFRYAIKNIFTIENNSNTSSIFALFMELAVILLLFVSLLGTMTSGMQTMINGDYLVTNVMSDGINTLESDERVSEIFKVYYGYGRIPGKGLDVVGTDSARAFCGESVGLEKFPKKGEVAITSSVLKKLGYEIGQNVPVSIEGKTYNMTICDDIKSNQNFILVNLDGIDVEATYLSVLPEDDIPRESFFEVLAEDLSFQNATILPVSYFFTARISNNIIYVKCIIFNSVFIAIFAVIGLVNSILSAYRSRTEEFACYEGAGMTRKSIGKMKAKEIICTLAFGILMMALMAGLIYYTVYTFCINIWLDISIL